MGCADTVTGSIISGAATTRATMDRMSMIDLLGYIVGRTPRAGCSRPEWSMETTA
jgi:hypothetical protein